MKSFLLAGFAIGTLLSVVTAADSSLSSSEAVSSSHSQDVTSSSSFNWVFPGTAVPSASPTFSNSSSFNWTSPGTTAPSTLPTFSPSGSRTTSSVNPSATGHHTWGTGFPRSSSTLSWPSGRTSTPSRSGTGGHHTWGTGFPQHSSPTLSWPSGRTTSSPRSGTGMHHTWGSGHGTGLSTQTGLTTGTGIHHTWGTGHVTGLSTRTRLTTLTTTARNGSTIIETLTQGNHSTTLSGIESGTTTNSRGQTVITNSVGTFTVPGNVTSATTIFKSGFTFTWSPGVSTTPSTGETTTNSAGQTVLSNSGGSIVIPTGLTSELTTTMPNGETTTFVPATTTVGSDGHTTVRDPFGVFPLPFGLTAPFVTTLPDGSIYTIWAPPPLMAPTSPTGPSGSSKSVSSSSSTPASCAVPTGDVHMDVALPLADMICQPTCDETNVYYPSDVMWAYQMLECYAKVPYDERPGDGVIKYPHKFHEDQDDQVWWDLQNIDGCDLQDPNENWFEYPLTHGGWFGGESPGADRVLAKITWSPTKYRHIDAITYCLTMTHPEDGPFHSCHERGSPPGLLDAAAISCAGGTCCTATSSSTTSPIASLSTTRSSSISTTTILPITTSPSTTSSPTTTLQPSPTSPTPTPTPSATGWSIQYFSDSTCQDLIVSDGDTSFPSDPNEWIWPECNPIKTRDFNSYMINIQDCWYVEMTVGGERDWDPDDGFFSCYSWNGGSEYTESDKNGVCQTNDEGYSAGFWVNYDYH